MKKIIIISISLIFITGSVAKSEELFDYAIDLDNYNSIFFETPITNVPDVNYIKSADKKFDNSLKSMPLFKEYRIRLMNYFRSKNSVKSNEINANNKIQQNENNIDENSNNEYDVNVLNPNNTNFEGGINKNEKEDDKVYLDAEILNIDPINDDIIAEGSPSLHVPAQNLLLKADKMIYNPNSNILELFDNVEIYKADQKTTGDYLQINMNEESTLIENINFKQAFLTIQAEYSQSDADVLTLYNGKMLSEESNVINLQTRMIGGFDFNNMLLDEGERSYLSEIVGEDDVSIYTKEIEIDAKKEVNIITLKNAQIKYGKNRDFTLPRLKIFTDKKQSYFEANYPEIGGRSPMGIYGGPSYTFDTPNGAVMKLTPMLNYDDNKLGFGGGIKYHSGTNLTELMYGSAADVVVLRGKQDLDDNLALQYGINSFIDNWWMGSRKPEYGVELQYRDSTIVKDTVAEGLNLHFENRASFGYMKDGDDNYNGENIQISNTSTTRTRYMLQGRQDLYNYVNEDNLFKANLSLMLQGSAALYGTGDTQMVGRVGPRITTQYKKWVQDLTYYASAYEDNTPMPVFDAYRYGKTNIYLREAYRVNKYFTVIWMGSVNLGDETYTSEMFQENAFLFAFGPDDLKVTLGYDFIRGATYFSVNVLMDTKGSSIAYDKMIIKNPSLFGASGEADVELLTVDGEKPAFEAMKQNQIYAEVIEIEDPNKEKL
ncbi:MAG: hypothetical protein R3Y28_04735 [Candidatus Gastranaerophilales bacterium]